MRSFLNIGLLGMMTAMLLTVITLQSQPVHADTCYDECAFYVGDPGCPGVDPAEHNFCANTLDTNCATCSNAACWTDFWCHCDGVLSRVDPCDGEAQQYCRDDGVYQFQVC